MTRVRILFTVALGLLAGFGIFAYLQSVPRAAAPEADVQRIWVVTAGRDLGAGAVLRDADLALEHLPAADLPSRALTCDQVDANLCDEVRRSLSGETLGMIRFTGEPITPEMLGPRIELQPDERAIAIRLNAVSGLAGLITPGQTVGIMATITDTESPTADTAAKYLFSGTRIVWLSPEFRVRAASPESEESGAGSGLALVALSLRPDAIVYERQSNLFASALDDLPDEAKREQGIDDAFIDSLRQAPDVLWGVPLEMVAAIAAAGGNFQLVMLPEHPKDLTTPGFNSYHLQVPIWDLLEEDARIEGEDAAEDGP